MLLVITLIVGLLLAIGIGTDTKTTLFSHAFSTKEKEVAIKSGMQRLEKILQNNISFQKPGSFSDLKTSYTVEEVKRETDTVVFSLISSTAKEKIYTFPVYAADDYAFQFSNFPSDVLVQITNAKGFNMTFSTSSFVLPKTVFYDDAKDAFLQSYGTYTVKVSTATGDLSLLSMNPISYTKKRTVWLRTTHETSKHTLYKKVTIENKLGSNNAVVEEVL